MALIERIMGIHDDGNYDPLNRGDEKIPVHSFYSSMQEVSAGRLPPAVFKSYFNIRTSVDASGKSDQEDLTNIVNTLPLPNTLQRAVYLNAIHSIFILSEGFHNGVRMPGYTTPALVRSKLGI
jgi:hypothetical protein